MQKMSNQKSTIGLDGNVTALIGYIIGILAIVLVFIEKDNKFVRFHAFQSTFYHLGFFAIYIVLVIILGIFTFILGKISFILGLIGSLLYLLLFLVFLAWIGGFIYAAVKAYQGAEFKLPIVGNMAENFTNK
jgi:uncharacterized membrane protein